MQILYSYRQNDFELLRVYDESPEPENFKSHIHSNYEIYCFISGDAEYMIEGNIYDLSYGSLLIMKPSEAHKVRLLSNAPYDRYIISFSENSLAGFDERGYLLSPFSDRTIGQKNLYSENEFAQFSAKEIIDMMCRDEVNNAEKSLQISAYFSLLLGKINDAFLNKNDEPSTPSTNAERLLEYINEHLFDEISLSMLSEQFFLSVSQINRSFKRATGTSVGEYILTKRLTEAKKLLSHGFSAAEVCQRSGFKDYSSFYRAYRKHFKSAPSDDMI